MRVLSTRTSSGGTTAWYLTDKLGSVRDIASSAGAVIDHVVYDTYGNIVTETNSANGDRFKYIGMEYDAAIGLYYDHARFYDPAAARFIKQDPLGMAAGDPNLYRYVGNSPTNMVDGSGLIAIAQGNTDLADGTLPSQGSSGPAFNPLDPNTYGAALNQLADNATKVLGQLADAAQQEAALLPGTLGALPGNLGRTFSNGEAFDKRPGAGPKQQVIESARSARVGSASGAAFR